MKTLYENGHEALLAEMWETDHASLRRILISWTRDIDAAEDLLQETYIRARAGITGYQGGDPHAWLTAIAKNVFYTHCRRQRNEVMLDEACMGTSTAWVGSSDHLSRLAVRQAIQSLPAILRDALILRHYGGLSFDDIAERCSCPVGTARRRVWTAVRQLQQILGQTRKERTRMQCSEISSTQMLEFLYGTLRPDKRAAVEAHLRDCQACADQMHRLREVLTSVDQVAGDFVLLYLAELDECGRPTYYTWGRMINTSDQPMSEFVMINAAGSITDFAAFQGEMVSLESAPWGQDPTRMQYIAHLPRPVMPGQTLDGMAVSHTVDRSDHAAKTGGGHWRFTQRLGLGAQRDAAIIVHGVRLPVGASLVSTSPEADSMPGSCATTVFWRLMPAPSEPVEFCVEYRL